MKILLINPVIRGDETPKYFPLGLGMIHAMLRQAGHHVEVLDLNALRPDGRRLPALLSDQRWDVIGLTGLITEYVQIRRLAVLLKERHPEATVILGGGLASSAGQEVLSGTEVDIVVRGEGEQAIVRLLAALETGTPLRETKGVCFREGDEVVQTADSPPILDLDVLPFPEREAFPVEVYLQGMRSCWMFEEPTRALSVLTGRGCPYRCVYCDKAIWGGRFRQRSPENVVEEIVSLRRRFGIEGVVFADDTFVLRRSFVETFCEELLRRAPGLSWVANGRMGRLDAELTALMKRAGCVTLGFGIESGSQAILDELNKQTTVEEMEQTIRWVKEAGIRPLGYLVVGSFSETPDTVNETVAFLNRVDIKYGVNFLTPFPGTPLYDEAEARGKIRHSTGKMLEHWEAWQDHLLVNLTDLPREELAGLKRQVQLLGRPDATSASAAYLYLPEEQEELWERAIAEIAQEGHERLILFGAGAHTRRFLKWYRNREGPAVAAILDQDSGKRDEEGIEGIPVVNRLPRGHCARAVLLSSDRYEDQMWDQARTEFDSQMDVYRIYDG